MHTNLDDPSERLRVTRGWQMCGKCLFRVHFSFYQQMFLQTFQLNLAQGCYVWKMPLSYQFLSAVFLANFSVKFGTR